MSTTDVPLLEIDGLSVSYGKVEALHGFSLRLSQGQVVTVIGPNGAGKTTLLAATAGLLPSRGTLRLDGEPIDRLTVEERAQRGLCLVPEKRELFTTMTVEDNLLLGTYPRVLRRDRHPSDGIEQVYALFPRLKERRRQEAGTLSGGERQMLALGRALVGKPRVLMLDEPSLGLAPLIVREIFNVIGRLRAMGVATLLVEQNARAALQASDYGYVLETGELRMQGAAQALADDPRIVETYLGLGRAAPEPTPR